jgi:hypothetical protein
MIGVPNIMRNLALFNPCRILVCYAVLFVVRAEENVEVSTQITAFQAPRQELPVNYLSGDDLQALLTWNGTNCEGIISYSKNDEDVGCQSLQRSAKMPLPNIITGECTFPSRIVLVFVKYFVILN